MAENKFRKTSDSITEFIDSIQHSRKQQEAQELITLFENISGYPPVLWSHGIIGFGDYHYRYDSGTEGDMPILAFSPRKARHSIYLMPEFPQKDELLAKLGKYKLGKSCLYVNKLADIDLEILREILRENLKPFQ